MVTRFKHIPWRRPFAVVSTAVVLAAAAVAYVAPMAHAEDADTPWVRHTITGGARGADGVNLVDINGDGRRDVTSAWEESGLVTVSLHPEVASDPWPTVVVGQRLSGAEDAIFADVNGDGGVDVVSACECKRVVIHFGPVDPLRILEQAAWASVTLAASVDLQRWIKVAVVDVDGDRRLDVVGGGKVSPATVGWFRAPANPRDGAAWRYTPMSDVGWTMSLLTMDVDRDTDQDVVLSDRIAIREPNKPVRNELRGSRWLENRDRGARWTNHRIGFGEGEHKFLHVVDFDRDGRDDVLDGVSEARYNRTYVRRNLGPWGPWAVSPLPQPEGVGHYQDVKVADIDADHDLDVVFSYSHAQGDLSGVVWLASGPGQTWERGEISGPPGTKFDNVELDDVDGDGDPDVVTSEQVEQLGVVWYENPTVAAANEITVED